MTAPVLPYIQGAVREFLMGNAVFLAACPANRIFTRQPDSVTGHFAVVKAPPGIPIEASAGLWSPLIQVEGYSPPAQAGQPDPELVAWNIAAAAAAALCRVRNRSYQTMHWSARIIDGPLPDVDTTRGADTPLYRALVRAELTVHAR